MTTKPTLFLAGGKGSPPTADDVLDMFTRMTGRIPTPEDVAETPAILAACIAAHASKT